MGNERGLDCLFGFCFVWAAVEELEGGAKDNAKIKTRYGATGTPLRK